jgi:pimeloyl-ACP methyl ester carboxylesterase
VKRVVTKVNGLDIFYRDTLEGGETILCLHGKWGRGETWADFIRRYRDRYRIVAPDQRGHGLSEKPVARYAPQDLAADAHALIEKLGCGPAIVVGHSMGGRVGAFLAALHPEAVKALAILDCGPEGPETVSSLPPERISPVDELTSDWPAPYESLQDALDDLSARFPMPSNVRYFQESLVETVEGFDFLFGRFAMAALKEYMCEWYSILHEIRCPVLLVRAEESWDLSKESAERMRELIEDCTYYEVSRSDHMVYADNPAEFYEGFDRFLGKVSIG